MHGRIKVRTSEEEKLKKERERQEKLKVFKHAMHVIQNKRQKCELDTEQLDVTGQVLIKNPDIYTLWNIRREILIVFRSNLPVMEMTKIYDAELSLTEYCLKINPKSYCAWHQREWVLMTRGDPDWQKELALCNTYLKLDERNFHTWDYRRFVVSQCKPDLQDEFNYTTEKLHDNFSNYSAWHYRSKMLLQLFPDKEGGRPIQDSHYKRELKMVLSAAFTDPDDTSAWFYQRWLLGAVKNITQIVVCTVTLSKVSIAFNNCVSISYIKEKIKLIINNHDVVGEWKSCLGNEHDDLWVLNHDQNIKNHLDIKVEHILDDNEIEVMSLHELKPGFYVGRNKISFQNKYSTTVLDELNEQLDACRQLLELEPDNKWTLLTTAFFLHCVDAKTYHKDIIDIISTLINIDEQRAGYYNDLKSKWCIEDNIQEHYANLTLHFKVESKKLSSLPHLQYYSFCEAVDLSNQNLPSRVLPGLIKLQHCKKLNLSNNRLTSLKGFPYLTLEELIITDNPILENHLEQLRKKLKNTIIIF
ncbi:geranylgeranyl transferase type-2 subunit alpha isoform X1 [Pieris rapae]|uniref:geranylgeranyl transferase type-2 subunit alpha isoform X1 n=2 Tax=Pieris rapae TaxID=64459 RepID=UPI001E27E5B6|nr:geranylgeranyl transferase type-2 subunit alpha isoform X1 [Pieris rapae]